MDNPIPLRVLILCTGNSARSIIGEYLLRAKGKGRFEVYSAGSAPVGRVNPLAIWVLQDRFNIDARDARSKSWDEFKSVNFDCVITVCDKARDVCPVWPGKPILAHWGSPDPAACEGSMEEKKWLFVQVASQIACRVDLLCALPASKLLEEAVVQIGKEALLEAESPLPRR